MKSLTQRCMNISAKFGVVFEKDDVFGWFYRHGEYTLQARFRKCGVYRVDFSDVDAAIKTAREFVKVFDNDEDKLYSVDVFKMSSNGYDYTTFADWCVAGGAKFTESKQGRFCPRF